jgi:uncharacterized LabA/DUF88 family protein
MKKSKAIVLIDGSNFYFKLKDLKLNNLLGFNFTDFIKLLAGKNQIEKTVYYIGAVRTDGTDKTKRLFQDQRKLLAGLKQQGIKYSLGYLLKSSGKFHEKGVDVNIAVDILVATYEKLCQRIILVSSDTDLLPAVKKAREKGIIVEYVGFSHRPSLAMIANCTESRLLKKDDLVKLINKKA